jgi:hypothetical protein
VLKNDNDNSARESKTKVSATDTSTSSKHSNNNKYGMCHTLHKLQLSFVDCLTHTTTILSNNNQHPNQQQQAVGVSFDIVRIIPTIGPMKDMTEAIVLVVGSSSTTSRSSSSNRSSSGSTRCSTQEETCNNDNTNNNNNNNNNNDEKWYNNNDMNASIIQLIYRLSNSNDCPWLNKVIYIISPNNNNSNNNDLGDVVDAFLSSYLGGDTTNNNNHSTNQHDDTTTMLLPLEYTYPIIRSLIVINDVHDAHNDTESTTTTTKSKVKILPQGGINNGILPNLDIVFATTMSLQSQPSINNGQWDRSKSLYYSGISNSGENNNEPHFTIHPNYVDSPTTTTATTIIEQYTYIFMHYVFVTIFGYDSTKLNQYISDMSGMLSFLMSMIIGP